MSLAGLWPASMNKSCSLRDLDSTPFETNFETLANTLGQAMQ